MLTKENVGKQSHKIAHFRVGCGMLKNVRFRITAQSFAESAIFAPMKVLLKRQGSNPHGIIKNPSKSPLKWAKF
jgi:hypothetical protein